MIALYIIVALVLLIALILFLNVSFIFELREEFTFKIKILFITLNGDKIASLVGNKGEENKKEQNASDVAKKKKLQGVSEILDAISYISGIIKAIFGEFIRYARLKVCYVDVKIATEDAARTALIYGTASSSIYTALEFLDTFLTLKKNYKKINVYPDFTTDKTEAKLKIIIRIKPIHVLLAVMHLLPEFAAKKKGN